MAPLAVAALMAGCAAEERSSFELRPGGRPVTEEDIQKAVQRLLEPVAPVPYPETRLPEPPAGFVRLGGLLAEAEVLTEYEAPVLRDRELLPPGGLSLHKPARAGKAAAGESPSVGVKKNIEWLQVPVVGGVEAEEIAEIIVLGSFGSAERFAVKWGVGALGIEVQETEGIAEYVISADGLTNFEGTISQLRIGVPNAGRRQKIDMVLESVRIRDRRAAYHEAAGLARRRLAREVREAVYAHGTTTLRLPPLAVDGEQSLSFGVAVLDQPVGLRLSVESGGGSTVIFDEQVDNTEGWREHTLPVAAAGEMWLVAELDGPPEAVAFIANPTLYRPRVDPPRILFYLVDTLGANHMSLHGYPRPTSPYLERLANRGGWFANGFANSSWTGESVALLLTSMHTRSNGIDRTFSRLPEEFVTLPEVLASAGYATAAFSTNANAGPRRGTDQGFDSFFDHIAHISQEGELRTVPIPEVVNWLESRRDRPTFLYVHTAEPHDPYQPPPPYDTLFDADYVGWVDGHRPRPRELRNGSFGDREQEHLIARYDGEVAFADRMFGALVDELEARGLLDDTLIVVTADHGEGFGQHDKYGHGVYLYPELVRVPIIFGGGGLPSVGRLDVNAQLLDLMPTLIDLAGLDVALPYQGESLAPLLRGEDGEPSADRPILLAVHSREGLMLALARAGWKLDLNVGVRGLPEISLFDMEADPGEDNDLVEEYPEAARVLLRDLVAVYRSLPRYGSGQTQRYEISQEQIERLRALGYLQ